MSGIAAFRLKNDNGRACRIKREYARICHVVSVQCLVQPDVPRAQQCAVGRGEQFGEEVEAFARGGTAGKAEVFFYRTGGRRTVQASAEERCTAALRAPVRAASVSGSVSKTADMCERSGRKRTGTRVDSNLTQRCRGVWEQVNDCWSSKCPFQVERVGG